MDLQNCTMCPRECGANRRQGAGACGTGAEVTVCAAAPHMYEEPCISGTRGSGAIFFGGCSLHCVYCQNKKISGGGTGKPVCAQDLAETMLRLQGQGVHNINLVTAAHCLHVVIPALRLAKPHLRIPVVYNSSAYEKTAAIAALDGLVDVFLPDFKYCCPQLAEKYSSAPDYPAVAQKAIAQMLKQTGSLLYDADGTVKRGTIIRHLVLPGCKDDSVAVLKTVAEKFPLAAVSLMRQYTPEFCDSRHPELMRRVTSYEYGKALDAMRELGLKGYCQQKESATPLYTPNFS